MAREVQIVVHQPAVGSRIDNNTRRKAPVADGAFERLALGTTRSAISKAAPGAKVFVVAPLAEDLFPAIARTTAGDDAVIPADLKEALVQQGSQQLLVWSRLKSDSRIRGASTADLGSGQLEGIGLYLDRFMELAIVGGRGAVGFIAPFMHARATLVDVASGKVISQQRVETGEPYTTLESPRPGGGSIDDAFNADERVQLMATFMVRQIEQVVPALLALR
jgi:hypothetical protein